MIDDNFIRFPRFLLIGKIVSIVDTFYVVVENFDQSKAWNDRFTKNQMNV